MAQLLTSLDARIFATMTQERGKTGLGPDAAARYITAGRFALAINGQSPRERGYPPQLFDRCYLADYGRVRSEPDPDNPADPTLLRFVEFELLVGCDVGVAMAGGVVTDPGTTETALYAAENPRVRIQSDADAIVAALTCQDIFSDTTTDPQLIDCLRLGPTRVETVRPGQLLGVTPFRAWIAKQANTRYNPDQ